MKLECIEPLKPMIIKLHLSEPDAWEMIDMLQTVAVLKDKFSDSQREEAVKLAQFIGKSMGAAPL